MAMRGKVRMAVSVVKAMRRSVTYMPRPGDGAPRGVTLIPGDGIGPLVTNAVEQVMEAMHAPLYFEKYEVHGDMRRVPEEVLDSIRKNKVCLKGGLRTPVGGGVSSLNVQLRKDLDLYASLVNCFNLPGLPTRHDNVDIVVIRENTEGEYAGLEHEVVPGVVESLKVKLLSPFFQFTIIYHTHSNYNSNPLTHSGYVQVLFRTYCKICLRVCIPKQQEESDRRP